MAYIDKDYFEAYTTTEIENPEFTVLAERASDVVDMLTHNRIIAAGGFDELPAATQLAVQKATAAEVETLFYQGGVNAVVGNSDSAAGSVSIGKVSMSNGAGGLQTINGIPVSPLISQYLLLTGLLYRGF